MASNFNNRTSSTSFTVDNKCSKKQKYKFVALSNHSNVKVNEEVAVGKNSAPAVQSVVQVVRSPTYLSTATSNTSQLMATVSVKDSTVRK